MPEDSTLIEADEVIFVPVARLFVIFPSQMSHLLASDNINVITTLSGTSGTAAFIEIIQVDNYYTSAFS